MWKKCVNVISLPMKGGIYVMYNCENKIIHLSKKKLSSSVIKTDKNSGATREYMRYINNGTITYRKFKK